MDQSKYLHTYRNAQWLATIKAGFACTVLGLYTNIPILFGFSPKLEIWYSVDAGMEARPPGAVPVGVLVVPGGVDEIVVVGGGVAEPGKHCE